MNSPLQVMRNLLEEDTRYKFEAYQFIRESLQYAHEHLNLPNVAVGDEEHQEAEVPFGEPQQTHVTGQQLCESCRQYALEQYGYLAKMVLGRWGIESTSDLGELVYNLIRIEQMRKSETDRREDFDDVYDFENAFDPKFELLSQSDD